MKTRGTILFWAVILQTVFSFAFGQAGELYFPTGTSWEEALIDPDPVDTLQRNIYEIGGDTVINAVSYKSVLKNGKQQNRWLREQDGVVWILSDLCPVEVAIYDFNWQGTSDLAFSFLSVDQETGAAEVRTCLVPTDNIRSVTYGGELYWYVADVLFGDTIVDRIGRIRNVDLDCSLLGCVMYEPVLPGLIYSKVLWIKRNGSIVFESKSFEQAVCRSSADLTGDGRVDIADVNAAIDVMLGKSASTAADITGDGRVDIADVNAVINVMLGQQ